MEVRLIGKSQLKSPWGRFLPKGFNAAETKKEMRNLDILERERKGQNQYHTGLERKLCSGTRYFVSFLWHIFIFILSGKCKFLVLSTKSNLKKM